MYYSLLTFSLLRLHSEGPEHLLLQDTVRSPTITSDLEQICQNIIRHIAEVSSGIIAIQRMVLYFKLDDNNRLWLLFCTNIKTRERNNGQFVQTNVSLSCKTR